MPVGAAPCLPSTVVPSSTKPRYLPRLASETPEFGLMVMSRTFASVMIASVGLLNDAMRLPASPFSLSESTTDRSPLATAAVAYGSADVLTVPSAKVSS